MSLKKVTRNDIVGECQDESSMNSDSNEVFSRVFGYPRYGNIQSHAGYGANLCNRLPRHSLLDSR